MSQLPMSGGSGAAEYVQGVAGGMNEQTANANGSIQLNNPIKGGMGMPALSYGGVGMTEAMVPAVLFLANNAITKNLLRNSGVSGKTLKNVKRPFMKGGDLANAIAVPAGLILANNYFGKSMRSRSLSSTGLRSTQSKRKFGKKQIPKSRRFRERR